MYISGHLSILEDLVKNHLPESFFSDMNFKKFNYRELKKGIQYVDAPCGKYGIKENSIFMHHRRVCEVTKLAKLYFETEFGESKIFQFHKGFFAHLHAMTTDSENKLEKIRKKIILSVLGYSLLAVYDGNVFQKTPKLLPNSMWAGMVLHIITDSYSPAHTIRSPKIGYVEIESDNNIGLDKQIRLRVHEQIKRIAKENIIFHGKHMIDRLKADLPSTTHKFIDTKERQLQKIYEVFKFEYDTNKLVTKIFSSINKIPPYTGKEIDGDIVAFQYYEQQPSILHIRLDQLKYVKENPKLYERMLSECKQFMLLYKKVLDDGDIGGYLDGVFQLMINGTFRVHKRYLKDKTNKIVANY